MRIAVLGSGGIGGYYGALLAKGGHDVVFVARGAHLEALQRRGLTVQTPAGHSTLPVTAVADTRSVVYVALQLAGPGVIRHTGGNGQIVFGEPGGTVTGRAQRVAAAFQLSGVPHAVSTDINRVLWEKFLFISGVGGVTALAQSGIGPLLASPEGRALLTASCGEIAAVGQAEGRPLPPDAVDAVLSQAAMLPGEWRSSMARDLQDGRRLEVDALSGAVVRRGLTHGIPTPVHQTIAACLSLHQPRPLEQRATAAPAAARA